MLDHSPTSPRRRPRRPLAAVVAIAAVGMLLFTAPISTQAQQPPEFDGGGTVTTDTPNTTTTPDGKQIAPPSQDNPDARPCAYFYDNAGASHPDYRGRYSVTDNAGNVHTYDGPMKVTIGWSGTYEGPDGTFRPPTSNTNVVSCTRPVGHPYPLTHASRTGSSGDKSLSCTYDIGPAGESRFWRNNDLDEVENSEFVFNLFGTCKLVDAGFSYGFTTHERRLAITVATVPGAIKGMQGVSQVTWVETYKATTKCTLNCDPPAEEETTPDTDPTSETTPTTEVEQTTTTTGVVRSATTTTTRPAAERPPDGGPPSRGTLAAGPVQAPGSPGTPSGGLPSGLAGPATGGGGFGQAPTPVAGSAPTAASASATATAAGGAPVGSSALVPGAAAAPGTAGAAARVAAPLPLIAAVPGADAAPNYNMVRHERPAIPAPVLALGGGLWLMFVCAAGVRILTPRPEPEPVPAPAVGFPVDIEEESP